MLVDLWTDDDNVLAEKEKKRTSFEPAKGLLLQSKYRSRDFPGSRCPVIVLVSKKKGNGKQDYGFSSGTEAMLQFKEDV